jgi:hypothetical protein
LVLACIRDELAHELGGTDAHAAPSFQQWQHDRSQIDLIGEQSADILLERVSLARGNER